LVKYFNANQYDEIEFWIESKIYHPDDRISLAELNFNPKINIVKIATREYNPYNSSEMNCNRRDKNRQILEIKKIKFNFNKISKITYVWETLFKNIEKLRDTFPILKIFRESLTDNKFEIRIVEQTYNEILELTEIFLEELKKKLKRIE